jgi:exopolysaccharide biosynthesis polyprenyl glycosylphosphotransferase
MSNRAKAFLFLLADIAALYASLFAMLVIHYGRGWYGEFVMFHAMPFSVVFAVWILVFYVAGLYDLRRLRNNIDFLKTLFAAIAIGTALAVALFYTIPAFGITPKTNLLIFVVIFTVAESVWRRFLNRLLARGEAPHRVLFVGDGPTKDDVAQAIRENAQLGYAIVAEIDEKTAHEDPSAILRAAKDYRANVIVIPPRLTRTTPLAAVLYHLFSKGYLVSDLVNFYETVMRKVPLEDLEEAWFLENIENVGQFYDPLKRAAEFVFALALGILLLPLEILIALLVRITSRGPVLIRQTRTGRLGRPFTLYKFRSMYALAPDGQAETHGAEWSSGARDPRITPLGRVLRVSHLDELPQFINLIRGDTSFVGPRPERPEIVDQLKAQIPFYEVRLLVTPGVTGWAQINHRADRGLEDVQEKLRYDVYYLKNRSLALDVAIILRTLKTLFVNPQE